MSCAQISTLGLSQEEKREHKQLLICFKNRSASVAETVSFVKKTKTFTGGKNKCYMQVCNSNHPVFPGSFVLKCEAYIPLVLKGIQSRKILLENFCHLYAFNLFDTFANEWNLNY